MARRLIGVLVLLAFIGCALYVAAKTGQPIIPAPSKELLETEVIPQWAA